MQEWSSEVKVDVALLVSQPVSPLRKIACTCQAPRNTPSVRSTVSAQLNGDDWAARVEPGSCSAAPISNVEISSRASTLSSPSGVTHTDAAGSTAVSGGPDFAAPGRGCGPGQSLTEIERSQDMA